MEDDDDRDRSITSAINRKKNDKTNKQNGNIKSAFYMRKLSQIVGVKITIHNKSNLAPLSTAALMLANKF